MHNNSCSKSPTINEVRDNLPKLMNSIGMSKTCKTATEAAFTEASASGQGSLPFASVSAQASMSAAFNKTNQEGCGSVMSNINTTQNTNTTLNCSIQESSNSISSVSVNTNSIIIETIPLTPEEINAKEKIIQQKLKSEADFKQLILVASMNPSINPKLIIKLSQISSQTFQNVLDSYSRNLTISDSKISQHIKSNMKLSIRISGEAASKAESNLKAVAKIAAENKMKSELGLNAISPSQKSFIQNNVNNNTSLTNTNIQKTVNEVNAKVDSSNNLVIRAPGKIDLKNTTIDQNILSMMATDALLSTASTAGLKAVSDYISDIASKSKATGKSAGLDDLAKAIAEGQAAKMKASIPPAFGFGGGILLVIAVIVGFMMFKGTLGSAVTTYIVPTLLLISIICIIIGAIIKNTALLVLSIISTVIFAGLAGYRFIFVPQKQ